MTSTSLVPDTLKAAWMVRTLDPREILLPEGVLTTETEDNRPAVSALKGIGLNLAMLPNEALHNL